MDDTSSLRPPGADESTQFLTGSIDDYLLGLADGLQKAQRQLSQMALIIQPGEAAVTYQIPRLEFELKMSLEVVTPAEGASGGALLRFRPASPGRTGTSTSDVASTIRGAFVAVPVHAGKPPPSVRITLRRINERSFEVRVLVTSAAGERLPGVDVHFNIDRQRSRALKIAPDRPRQQPGRFNEKDARYDYTTYDDSSDLLPGTRFWDGLVTTDAAGVALGVLAIDALEPRGTRVAAVVDVLGQTETIVFPVE